MSAIEPPGVRRFSHRAYVYSFFQIHVFILRENKENPQAKKNLRNFGRLDGSPTQGKAIQTSKPIIR